MNSKKLFSLLMLFAIAVVPSALAEEHTDELTADPGLVGADSPLYGLELAFENAITNVQLNAASRAERELRLAEERAAEADNASSAEGIQRAVLARERNLVSANESSSRVSDPATRAALKDAVASSQERHIAVLERVREQVPDVAKAAISMAIENSERDADSIREEARSIREDNDVSSEQAQQARQRVQSSINRSVFPQQVEEGVDAAGTVISGSPDVGSFEDTLADQDIPDLDSEAVVGDVDVDSVPRDVDTVSERRPTGLFSVLFG